MTRWQVPGYTPIRTCGTDASGSVSLARHVPSTSRVVIRFLPAATLREPGVLPRLREDVRLLGTIRHPGLPRVLGCVESAEGVAVIREDVEGAVPVRTLLENEGALGPEAAAAVLKGTLAALAAAHAHGVAHGGCTRDTVLVTTAGTIAVVDFATTGSQARRFVASGVPFAMAPEQWAALPAESGLSADLYAAAAGCFECLAGAPPFFAVDPASLRRAHESAPVPLDAVPSALRELLARGLAKQPADRPADAAAFLGELDRTAVAAYGPDWEDRGRAELAALVAGRGTPARLSAAELPTMLPAARRQSVLGRPGRIAAAVAFAGVLGLQLSTLVAPDVSAGGEAAFVYGEAGAVAGTVSPQSTDPARTAYEWDLPGLVAAPLVPAAATSDPAPTDVRLLDVPPEPLTPSAAPGPGPLLRSVPSAAPGTPAAPPAAGGIAVTSVAVASFTHQGAVTRLVVDVVTTGTAPVELLLDYASGRRGDLASVELASVTRTLSGATSYRITDERPVPAACADEWLVLVRSSPDVLAGPQVGHISLDPCVVPKIDPPATGTPPSGDAGAGADAGAPTIGATAPDTALPSIGS